ncbi:hypothetical protein B0T25DRAFT_281711 [Lasiosphaeria hispida]|uniref:Uncharacterized protein n=1 Tax=Lasiosphaeria hispida TaxID=260671 RepID=A0AAJ0MAS7_9PEZI|nr:hypothetical protein B0T25DRAFT_281711 [Lasiosphaeria hispida]
MCHLNQLHFSTHAPWRMMATQPFSANREGDFADPLSSHGCACAVHTVVPLTSPVGHLAFNPCPDHHCCSVWLSSTYCQWAWENREAEFNSVEPGLRCPNRLLTVEVVPATRTLLEGDADENSPEVEPRAKPQFYHPIMFPVDMMYSNKKVDETLDWSSREYRQLERDRQLLFTLAINLWEDKEELKRANELTDGFLRAVERDMDLGCYDDPFHSERAYFLLQWVAKREYSIINLFRDFLSRLRSILAFLHRYPEEGKVVSSEDGFYSISHAVLSLGLASEEIDDAAIYSLCDGPLRQSDALQQRFGRLRDAYLSNPRLYSHSVRKRKCDILTSFNSEDSSRPKKRPRNKY